jgi:hypothetical protein
MKEICPGRQMPEDLRWATKPPSQQGSVLEHCPASYHSQMQDLFIPRKRPMRISSLSRPVIPAFVFVFAMLAAAQTLHWKIHDYSDEGFTALYPSLPDVQKKSIDTPEGTFELRTYSAGAGDSTLMVGICDYGPVVASKNPDQMLVGAKNSMVANSSARVISEKKIVLDKNPGIEFEAENGSTHFSVRMYIVQTTMYQTLVASPLSKPFNQTKRFLDSFQLVARTKYESQD